MLYDNEVSMAWLTAKGVLGQMYGIAHAHAPGTSPVAIASKARVLLVGLCRVALDCILRLLIDSRVIYP